MNIHTIRENLLRGVPPEIAVKCERVPHPTRGVVSIPYYSDSEDEEVEPESVIWPINKDERPDLMKPSEVLNSITPPEYDWRRKTRKGRQSRANFTRYLLREIKEICA